MYQCDKVEILLSEYVSGDLPEAVQREMANHLATCDSCRQEEELETRLRVQVTDLPLATCPRDVTRGILDEIERTPAGNRRKIQGSWLLGAATLVAAGLALILLLPGTGTRPMNENMASFSQEEINVATGEAHLALARLVTVINSNEKSSIDKVFGQKIPGAVGGTLRHLTKNLQGEV